MTPLSKSLSRTLLLMRDEVRAGTSETVLLHALTSTSVALIADNKNLSSHAAQTAFVTAAILMLRSGHQVFLMAPNVEMVAPQPPLQSGAMIDQLEVVGKDLIPSIEFMTAGPQGEVDLAIAFGDTPFNIGARRRIRLNAEAWIGAILRENESYPWRAILWPFGALAAAALGAGEAFKVAMLKLLPYAINPTNTAAIFAPIEGIFELAPGDATFGHDLGEMDCVSGGAITNSVLYCLARIPAVRARGRIIEPDTSDLTNLNRNMLLLRSGCEKSKARGLAQTLSSSGLCFQPLPQRFDANLMTDIAPLAPTVVVGVDHIPTRWAVQEERPEWLVIGATTHWSSMASFHSDGLGCARCLHDRDDQDDGLIPTTACVSFWAGLLVAVYLARHAAGDLISTKQQQTYLTPFRPESAFHSAVAVRKDCPTCQRNFVSASGGLAA